MAIKKVTVNHTERNWFGDYDEQRSDEMLLVSEEKVAKAIERLHRRYIGGKEWECLFVTNDDGTGWRLMHDKTKGGKMVLRHYTNMEYGGWDTDQIVGVAKAKSLILGQKEKAQKF